MTPAATIERQALEIARLTEALAVSKAEKIGAERIAHRIGLRLNKLLALIAENKLKEPDEN